MPNIQISTGFVYTGDGSNVSSNTSQTTTSSNWVGGDETISSGSWTQLTFNSGSLTDVYSYKVQNVTTTYSASIIAVATGSAGQGILTYIYPGGQFVNTWSGSYNNNQGVYVSVVGGWPRTTPTPLNGEVQWKVVQS